MINHSSRLAVLVDADHASDQTLRKIMLCCFISLGHWSRLNSSSNRCFVTGRV